MNIEKKIISYVISVITVFSFVAIAIPLNVSAAPAVCGTTSGWAAATDCKNLGCTGSDTCEIDSAGDYCCVTIAGNQFGLGGTFNSAGLGQSSDLKSTIASIINIILGFLGILAVLVILYGGFKWMTAAGNEDGVSEARGLIVNGVIGLVVIFVAWGIASFVISQLQSVTQ